MRARRQRAGERRVGRLATALRSGAVLVALLLAAPAAAQQAAGPVQAAEAKRASDEAIARLRSPYCPGLMLEVCPSAPAEALRDSIRDLAAEGYSADQLVEWMISRHGESWRAVPKRSGAGLWAWLGPPLFLLAGALALLSWLRWRAARRTPEPEWNADAPGLSDGERAELDAALRELEHEEEVHG